MFFFLLICGLASADGIFEGDKELVLVQALWRHGDRSPTGTYKNDYYQEPYWTFGGGGWGQLSPIGMTQHVNLGKMLRKRYIDETYKGYLSNYYNSKEVYYRSTDVNRTLISAMSNIVGMWSQPEYNNRVDTDYPNSTFWPTGFVPVPVHTVDDSTDFVGNVDATCSRQDILWEMAKTSQELVNFNTSPNMTSLLTYLTQQCGQPITTDNIDKVAGSFLIEKIHCPDFRKQNKFYTPALDDQMTDVNDQMDLYKNGVFNESPLMMNGLDIGLEIQKIRGGSMTNDIEMHMNIKLDCMAKNKTDGECAWISRLKYYVYSAHDTTVYAFFSCLGIQSKAVQPKGYPQYSAATLVELWYDHKEKQPYFKMLYHSADGQPFETITSDIDGCDGDFCKLDVYHKISQRVTPDMPMPQWCLVDPRMKTSNTLLSFTEMRIFLVLIPLCPTLLCKSRSSSSEEDLAMIAPMLNAMGELSGVMKQTIRVANEDEGFRREVTEIGINPLNLLSTAMSTMLETLSQRVPIHVSQRSESKVPHLFGRILSRQNQQSPELTGPHICVKEINRKLENTHKSVNVTQRCETFSQAVRCLQRRLTPEGSVETIRIQECCKGFTTDDITLDGCDQEVVPTSLKVLLSNYNVTKVPSGLPSSFTAIFSKDSPENVNIFPMQMMDYDLHDGDILTSTEDKKFIINHINQKTFINCVPMNRSNVFLTNGIAMIAEKNLLPAERTVLDILEKDGRFSIFLSVLSENVKEKLGSSSSSVTVMSFTDSRFEEFPGGLKEQIKSKQRCTASVIEKSHIFHKATCSQSLTSSMPSVTTTPSGKEKQIGEAKIVESDLVAINGIVHVVDNVIMKEEIISWHQKLNASSPLMAELLREQVEDSQPVTILVPTNLNESLITKKDALNHVIPWLLPSLNALPPTVTTMGNSTIFAGRFGSSTSPVPVFRVRKRPNLSIPQIGCSRLISDPKTKENQLSACGSTIFFLDTPLPKVAFTMKELLESRSDISRFASLFSQYSSNHSLPRVSTLFVPVDDAFAVNYFKKLKNDDEANEKLIQTHLIPRPVCQHDFHPEEIVKREAIINKNGDMLRVSEDNEEITIEGSKIQETIVVSDGVVHLVENVIRKESASFRSTHFDAFAPFSRH